MAEAVFSKALSRSDTTVKLAIPTAALQNFAGLGEGVLRVTDWNRDAWEFRLSTRKRGHPRPVFTGEWLAFARAKRFQVNDHLFFTRLEDGQCENQLLRGINFRLFGANLSLPTYVDQV